MEQMMAARFADIQSILPDRCTSQCVKLLLYSYFKLVNAICIL